MKSVLIMRHAKSSWKDPELNDHDRPLNKRGKRAAKAMGKFLKDQGLLPDLITGSTALRVRETVKFFCEGAGSDSVPIFKEELYHCQPEEILAVMKSLPESSQLPIIIGHNPGMEDLLSDLFGEMRVPTATVCYLKFSIDKWNELDGNKKGIIESVWRPKDLGIE
jgi:phosphohistidine phosphatase